MTVEQQVDALTASVEDLKGAVVSKKATLDASVADAQSARAQAQIAKVNALSARDQAEAFKDAAYTAAQSAASAVAYQDLSAVALTKAVTAIDVFIYNTSKDSDGGAWRHRCAGKSWYREPLNTATRGGRREFPAVAVIVAESNKVTIYDGDDPTLPMWMVFEGSWSYSTGKMLVLASTDQAPIRAISMRNAVLTVGTFHSSVSGLHIIDFVKERGRLAQASGSGYNGYTNHPNIAKRNAGLGISVGNTLGSIVNSGVNDVAMTVLSNAPIDHATGLSVPTIAVATAGGVSVIKDDGNIWDITGTNWGGSSNGLIFDRRTLYFMQASYYWLACDVAGLSRDFVLPDGYQASNDNYPFQRVNLSESIAYATALRRVAAGGSSFDLAHPATTAYPGTRLVCHKRGVSGGPNLVAYTTSSYNTGWLPGVIRGAFLADTDDADLVGSGELVDNGTFGDGLSGWVDFSEGAGSISVAEGRLSLVNGGSVNGDNEGMAYQIVPTVVGQRYQVAVDKASGSSIVQIGYGAGVAQYFQSGNDSNDVAFSFVAATTTTFITIRVFSANTTAIVEAVSMRIADADRSVNARSLVVNGTITRSPVATGAELVAYSGFNSANYLWQPYNSGLDFGTGDFCAMGWIELNSTGYGGIFHLSAEKTSTSNPGFCLYYFPTGVGFKVGTQTAQSTVRPSGKTHVCGVRSGTTLLLYLNGSLVGTYPNATNSATPSAGANLLVGGYYQTGVPIVASSNDKFALLRISATALTADQIRRIYEDEKALFQENAACTLYGASDAVTALAHDLDTGLLHVGTSAGRSVFKGLRRVANTTTPVATAIAAAGELVVEQ